MKYPIQPCIWFDNNAQEAATFYLGIFPDSKLIASENLTVQWELGGLSFLGLNGGPQFQPNPSVSFMWNSSSFDEIHSLYEKLSDGGTVLMPLGTYDFSPLYAWVADKYGVNWQLLYREKISKDRLVPSLLFTAKLAGKAEDAAQYWAGVFPESSIVSMSRNPNGGLDYCDLSLAKQSFVVMDSPIAHDFTFSEGISFVVLLDTQDEIDYYWSKLTEGGEESMCGWLKDRYGVSWQILPTVLTSLMNDSSRSSRVIEAFMKMRKFDIQTLLDA